MARAKRKSPALDKAQKRLAGIQSIKPTLDLGHGLTAAAYGKLVTDTAAAINTYNVALSKVDDALNEVGRLENLLNEMSERMLAAVGAVYGLDSTEYEMAGGTRRSERKRPDRSKSDE